MPVSEPCWLSADDIERINELEVEVTGEGFRVLSRDLLESAVARPQTHWHYADERDVVRLAAVLLEGIVRNHGFEQGNKRTAATAAILFMDINGYEWTMPDTGVFGVWVVQLIEREIDTDDLAELMRPHVRPKPD